MKTRTSGGRLWWNQEFIPEVLERQRLQETSRGNSVFWIMPSTSGIFREPAEILAFPAKPIRSENRSMPNRANKRWSTASLAPRTPCFGYLKRSKKRFFLFERPTIWASGGSPGSGTVSWPEDLSRWGSAGSQKKWPESASMQCQKANGIDSWYEKQVLENKVSRIYILTRNRLYHNISPQGEFLSFPVVICQ